VSALDPIVISIEFAVPPETAFDALTQRFSEWWPVATHSLSRHPATGCGLEARPGGAVDEWAPAGSRHIWVEVVFGRFADYLRASG
jgi:uncharacterized protein YndB with AHSA1/START domain